MNEKKNSLLIEELKKHDLCRCFWSNQISEELEQKISLQYEPIGEMGIYSKTFHFITIYEGNKEILSGSQGTIDIKISSNTPEYDIQKAIAGTDCFHNIKIQIKKNGKDLLTSHFRLWSGEDEKICGNKTILNILFNS